MACGRLLCAGGFFHVFGKSHSSHCPLACFSARFMRGAGREVHALAFVASARLVVGEQRSGSLPPFGVARKCAEVGTPRCGDYSQRPFAVCLFERNVRCARYRRSLFRRRTVSKRPFGSKRVVAEASAALRPKATKNFEGLLACPENRRAFNLFHLHLCGGRERRKYRLVLRRVWRTKHFPSLRLEYRRGEIEIGRRLSVLSPSSAGGGIFYGGSQEDGGDEQKRLVAEPRLKSEQKCRNPQGFAGALEFLGYSQ